MRHFKITDRLTKRTILITAAVSLAVGIGVGVSITQYLFSKEEGSPIPFIKPRRTEQVAAGRVSPLTAEMLRNTTYFLQDLIGNEPLIFSDGQAHIGPETPDATAETYANARIVHIVLGDLDKDGIADAVVEIRTNLGGTGTFPYLVAVLNRAGKPQQGATLGLGDRELINSLAIENGLLTVDLLTQGPNDGACCPSVRTVTHYRLSRGKFIQQD
ncbi:hypothetical protein HYW67_04080 [Candidatus Parcubacteria bacterium]|nr:hypothetical protein [Candidatus Parcubacteria bacterium]